MAFIRMIKYCQSRKMERYSMNQCFGCSTCKSADKPLEGFIVDLPINFPSQSRGTECKVWIWSSRVSVADSALTDKCRITPKAPRESAGATTDVIMTRKLFETVASGSGCYIHCGKYSSEHTLKTAQSKAGWRRPEYVKLSGRWNGHCNVMTFTKRQKKLRAVGSGWSV